MSHPAPLVVLSPGHSRTSKGAVSVGGVAEWDYMARVTDLAVTRLTALGISTVRVDRGTHGIGRLVQDVARLRPLVAVELHFNSHADTRAHGCETLHADNSTSGLALAKYVQRRMVEAGGIPRMRPLVPIRLGERGAGYLLPLAKVAAACLIEPFFGSNAAEWTRFQTAHNAIANALAVGIVDYLMTHHNAAVPRFAVDVTRLPLQPIS